MKIGVFSDTHDNLDNMRTVLEDYRSQDIEQLIHCGDMVSADTARLLDGFLVIYVDGNMDQAAEEIYRTLRDLNPKNVSLPTYEGELNGTALAVTHGDDEQELERLIQDGGFDYVFHGHTHRRRDERIGSTRVFNPGALGGLKFESWSYSVVDLDSGEIELIELD